MEFLLTVFLGASILFAFWLLTECKRKGSRSAKEIPGWNRPPSDSKTGDFKNVLQCGGLANYFLQQHKQGSCPVIGFWWENTHVVSMCSPQAFKDTESLYNRPGIKNRSFECLHGSKSIMTINDSEWKEKKRLVHNTIRGGHLKSFVNDFIKIAQDSAALWVPGKPMELKKEMFKMTLKAILDTSLGDIFSNDNGIEQLLSTYDACKWYSDSLVLNPEDPGSREELEFQEKLTILQDMVKRMFHSKNAGGKKFPLLEALQKSGDQEDVIVSNIIAFLGGFDTSGEYSTWLFHFVAKHPHVQEKLFEEIKNTINGNTSDKFVVYVMNSNSYLRQVLDEALRRSSPAVFTSHISECDLAVDGYHVPANTPMIHAFNVALNNVMAWQNPSSFDPERFAPGSKHAKRGHEFRPFGASCTRRCPANQFVYTMMSVFLTVLTQKFRFSVPEQQEGRDTSLNEMKIQVELRESSAY
jgi:cytochrome P450